jgi:hypothetical protein
MLASRLVADTFNQNIRGRDLLTKRQRGLQSQLRTSIRTLHIGAPLQEKQYNVS